MDPNRFDGFTRAFGSGRSRRAVLKSLAGAAVGSALAAAGLGNAAAATRKRSIGNSCNVNSDCVTNLCVQEARTRKICHCASAADCPAATDVCHSAACLPSGYCGFSVNVSASCDDGLNCTTGDVCQADGSCAGAPVVCQPLDECHVAGTCDPSTGACSNPAAPDSTACSGGVCCGGTCVPGNCCPICSSPTPVCNVDTCVQCSIPSDCPAPSDPCTVATCTANVCGTTAVGDDQAGACTGGEVCCGGACTDTSSDHDHCGTCTNVCGGTDTCSAGACIGAGTCAANTDYCFTGSITNCNGDSSCTCRTKVDGSMFCATGPALCATCNTDADCGVGWACLDLGTNCSTCGSGTPTHYCQAACASS
jgi:hypothetical protein